MSSAFGLWKVNSSFLTVTSVKVWENALLLLNDMRINQRILPATFKSSSSVSILRTMTINLGIYLRLRIYDVGMLAQEIDEPVIEFRCHPKWNQIWRMNMLIKHLINKDEARVQSLVALSKINWTNMSFMFWLLDTWGYFPGTGTWYTGCIILVLTVSCLIIWPWFPPAQPSAALSLPIA